MNMDALSTLESMITHKIGLDAASIGHGAIENALQVRSLATAQPSLEAYQHFLETHPDEFDNLIEELVIPETWFYRDDEIFDHLLDICRKRMENGRVTRILSLPCSTGEEIYSVAIHFHSHGIPSGAYQLTGTDISNIALEHARLGVYRDNAFRCKNADWLKTGYFTRRDNHYLLDENIRKMVSFTCANILHVPSLEGMGKFDIILCRNLLIYFNSDSKKQALLNLSRLLEDDGILFFGHAEGAAIDEQYLFRTPEHGISAFTRHDNTKKPSARLAPVRPIQTSPSRVTEPFQATTEPTSPPQPDDTSELETARRLADAGEYEKAMDVCRQCLDKDETDAGAYHVLGLIHEAMDNQGLATKYFKKALYLLPDDIDTLVHLALLHERDGDHKAAARYRQRIERIQQRSPAS